MDMWDQWLRQPQRVWVRRALFQAHLWTGVAAGLYIIVISLTGSALVFRNEIIRAYGGGPTVVAGSGPQLSMAAIEAHVRRAFPDYEVDDLKPGTLPNAAVEVRLKKDDVVLQRLFDPYSGEDLGNALSLTFRVMVWLAQFHDDFQGGDTGQLINAVGAAAVVALSLTGLVIWWPGVKTWRRSLGVVWRTNWRRFAWHLHSALGFWTVALIFLWGITGLYLSAPQPFSDAVDFLDPLDESNPVERFGDQVLYWLAYLHFGRFGNRLPGCGPVCDVALKSLWTIGGLVPPLLAVTGFTMWWLRVVRRGPRTVD